MTIREWLDAILAVIAAESLTDTEYQTFDLDMGMVLNQQAYDQLSAVLASRDLVSNTQERLVAFFTAKGIKVVPADKARSNVWLGSPL